MYTRDLPPSQREIVWYDCFANGKRHRFSFESDALAFARQFECNVFKSVETLVFTPDDDCIDRESMRLVARSRADRALHTASGSYDMIFKAFSEACEDPAVYEIRVLIGCR